jgi:hypothetical protein
LTTSPSYSSHPVFLKLKDDLKQEVSTLITNGTKILAEWADTYIQLLTIDRCSDILKQALQILECLTTFYVGAIGTPLWPSVEDKHLTLFLFKAYLSDTFCETSVLSNYFNLPKEDILLIGAKFLLKSDNDEETTKTLESLKLSDIDMEQYLDNFFLTEIFLNFDQILKISTLGAWHLHLEQSKQVMAAANMKSKLKSLQTINASAATALAITKATESLNHQQSLDVKTNLRISNLERDLSKQGHESNTIINLLKKSSQKNYQGSYSTEPVTSPETQALSKQRQNQKLSKKLKRNFIDLTTEEAKEELNLEKIHPTSIQSTKRAKKSQRKSLGPIKPANFRKEINTMEGHQNNSTISSTIPSDFVLYTARTYKYVHGAERHYKTASLPSTAASSFSCPSNLHPKFPPAPIWTSKWNAPFNTATSADQSQPFPEATSTFKSLHQSRPQPKPTVWKKSIPNISESFSQNTLNVPKNVFQLTNKTSSRRLAQRRKRRLAKKETRKHNCNKIGLSRAHRTEQYCLHNFGLCANPIQSIPKNFKSTLCPTPLQLWLQPKNLAFHNLCKTQKLPTGTKELLGLNLKFCLSSKNITNDIHKTMLQMAKTIRTRYFLQTNGTTENNTYEKQIYIKNTTWNPPPAPLHIEDKITEFEKSLKFLHSQLPSNTNI